MLFIFVQQKSYILKIHLAFYSWSLQTLKMTTLLEGLHFKCIIYFWIYVQLKLIITTKGIPQNKLKRQYTTHTLFINVRFLDYAYDFSPFFNRNPTFQKSNWPSFLEARKCLKWQHCLRAMLIRGNIWKWLTFIIK